MRSVEVFQILGASVGAVGAVAVSLEQRLVRKLKAHHATTVGTAVALTPMNRLSRWRLSRLLKHGAVHQTTAERYYFDQPAYRALRRRRASIAIPAVLAAVALVLGLHAIFG